MLLANDPSVALKPTSRFPSSDLDLALVVPDTVTAEKVIRRFARPQVPCSSTFNCSSHPVAQNSASWPIASGCSHDRTLTDDDGRRARQWKQRPARRDPAFLSPPLRNQTFGV